MGCCTLSSRNRCILVEVKMVCFDNVFFPETFDVSFHLAFIYLPSQKTNWRASFRTHIRSSRKGFWLFFMCGFREFGQNTNPFKPTHFSASVCKIYSVIQVFPSSLRPISQQSAFKFNTSHSANLESDDYKTSHSYSNTKLNGINPPKTTLTWSTKDQNI